MVVPIKTPLEAIVSKQTIQEPLLLIMEHLLQVPPETYPFIVLAFRKVLESTSAKLSRSHNSHLTTCTNSK